MATVHGIGQPQNSRQLRDADGNIILTDLRFPIRMEIRRQLNPVIVKVTDIVADHICDDFPLQVAQSDDLRRHNDIVRALIGIAHADEFAAGVKNHRDLQQQTVPAA